MQRAPSIPGGPERAGAVRFPIRYRLVLLSTLLLVLVSFGFTALNLALWRGWVEEDLEERAIAFAREIAATIGDRAELENTPLLQAQIHQILTVRQNVLQMDILTFGGNGSKVVATSHPAWRLPFTAQERQRVAEGAVVSRLIRERGGRAWEVLAPIRLQGEVAGAVAAKFSLERADRLASRIRWLSFGLTGASVGVAGLLMLGAIRMVVDRPVRRFMEAIARLRDGDGTARVGLASGSEFGILARHFDEMVDRIQQFNDELHRRIREATAELDARYREVERLHARLFELQRSLSHAERLAVSGRIMAEVAHELGTPLHSVAGHLELLRQDLPPQLQAGDAGRRLAIMEGQLARMTEIIGQLLDLTRRSPGEPGSVDVGPLVQETVELVRPGALAAGLALTVDVEPHVPPVRGHAGQLRQVVLNLLTNALDATPAGGQVTVRVSRPEAGLVEIAVSDTGHGIPPAIRKQIFDPFFSTKEPGRGTGLGLFISAQIVRDHGGHLEVESEEGRGSCFRVLLPAEP